MQAFRDRSGQIRFVACFALLWSSHGLLAEAGILVQQTTDTNTLANALGGTGLSIDSVSLTNGAAEQFGVYQNFSLIPNGVVLSSGNVLDAMGPPSPDDVPSTDTNTAGTSEFDAYGPGHIANFIQSFDVARMEVNFTLDQASAVAFSFIFGSIEYPNWVSLYTDSFLVFLDGLDPGKQITYDAVGNPVQVGNSFSDRVITNNTETAFGAPHGLIPRLVTNTGVLSAGSHTLTFEIGDVNDHILDSAVFLSDLRTTSYAGEGPSTEFEDSPEPSTILSLAGGVLGLWGVARRRPRRGRCWRPDDRLSQ